MTVEERAKVSYWARMAEEELLEVPTTAAPGDRVTLRTSDGQTISLTVPTVPGRPSEPEPEPEEAGAQRAARLKEEGNELYRARQPALAARAYEQVRLDAVSAPTC